MKTIKITIATLLLLTLANNAKSQATASATASATIVAPIGIVQSRVMDFGNVAVSASPGTVVMTPQAVRSTTGGVTLPATIGSVTRGQFLVTGQANYTYVVTLPSTPHTITHTNNTDVMTVDNFTSETSSGTNTIGAIGSQDLFVGATLNVAGSQLAGVYTSAVGFDVTVNYN